MAGQKLGGREGIHGSDTLASTEGDDVSASRKRFIVVGGRGGRGKSTLVRYLAERAMERGRTLIIADADRTNQTLGRFFGSRVASPGPVDRQLDDVEMREFADSLLVRAASDGEGVLYDAGGGDQFFRKYASEMDLLAAVEACGLEAVMMHVLGGDVDDMRYPEVLEPLYRADGSIASPGVFAPRKTLLVCNEGVLGHGTNIRSSFEPLLGHPVAHRMIARGARVVVMPSLICMRKIEQRGLSFRAAFDYVDPPGWVGKPEDRWSVMDSMRTRAWWGGAGARPGMEALFSPHEDCLP